LNAYTATAANTTDHPLQLNSSLKDTSMNTKIAPTAMPPLRAESQLADDRSSLQRRVGLLDGFVLSRHESKRAVAALDRLNDAQTTSTVNIGLTALALGEGKLRAALVAGTVGDIGALTVAVNYQTAGVVLSLTNGAAGEMFTHLQNRQGNDALLKKALDSGHISTEEWQRYSSVLHAIAEDDIGNGLRRAQNSKDAVEALADHATKGIANTKERLL
jgi:hypothetical protein